MREKGGGGSVEASIPTVVYYCACTDFKSRKEGIATFEDFPFSLWDSVLSEYLTVHHFHTFSVKCESLTYTASGRSTHRLSSPRIFLTRLFFIEIQ